MGLWALSLSIGERVASRPPVQNNRSSYLCRLVTRTMQMHHTSGTAPVYRKRSNRVVYAIVLGGVQGARSVSHFRAPAER